MELAKPAAVVRSRERMVAGFPVPLFSSVLGMSGLSMVWSRAQKAWHWQVDFAFSIQCVTVALFTLLIALYIVKILRHPGRVAQEWNHPIQLTFFSAISLGLVLIGTIWSDDAPRFAQAAWSTGVGAHFVFTLIIVRSWVFHTHYELGHVSPAWFVPVVGNIVIPIAAVRFAPLEIGWFFFSLGIVFWIVLKTIILFRLIFERALPRAMTPTLFIMIAPPAVAFLAYTGLAGSFDAFARVLYYISLFWLMLLFSVASRFWRLPFYLSAWSYSFPLAAVTLATFKFADMGGYRMFYVLAGGLTVVLSLVMAMLTFCTLRDAVNGELNKVVS